MFSFSVVAYYQFSWTDALSSADENFLNLHIWQLNEINLSALNVWRQVTSSVPINSFLVPCIYFQSVKRNYSNGKIYTANVFTSFEQMVQLQRARHSHLVRSVNLRLGFIFHRYKGFLKDCPSGNLNELVSKFWSKFSACKSREKTFLSSSLRHAAFCLFTKLNYIGLRSLLTTPIGTF